MSISKMNRFEKEELSGSTTGLNDMRIILNPFGEVEISLKVEHINQYLNCNLEDKKLGNKVALD